MNFSAQACRICLSSLEKINMLDIFSRFNLKEIHSMIMEIAPIQVLEKENNFPQKICKPCWKNLQNAYNFREQCIESDNQIRTHFSDHFKSEDSVNVNNIVNFDNDVIEIQSIKLENYSDNDIINDESGNEDHIDYENFANFEKSKDKKVKKSENKKNAESYPLEQNFECQLCKYLALDSKDFNQHKKKQDHYTEKEREERRKNWLESFTKKIKREGGEIECLYYKSCGKKFNDASKYKEHLETYHFVEYKNCQICGKKVEKNLYKRHLIKQHYLDNERLKSIEENQNENLESKITDNNCQLFQNKEIKINFNDDVKEKSKELLKIDRRFIPQKLKCEFCSFVAKNLMQFTRHKKKKDHYTNEERNRINSQIENVTSQVQIGIETKCLYFRSCKKTFYDPIKYKNHLKNFHYRGYVDCEICSTKIEPSLYIRHLRIKHNRTNIQKKFEDSETVYEDSKEIIKEYDEISNCSEDDINENFLNDEKVKSSIVNTSCLSSIKKPKLKPCSICQYIPRNLEILRRHKRLKSHYTEEERQKRNKLIDNYVLKFEHSKENRCVYHYSCKRTFNDSTKFRNHLVNYHFAPYVNCKICGKKVEPQSYGHHVRLKHNIDFETLLNDETEEDYKENTSSEYFSNSQTNIDNFNEISKNNLKDNCNDEKLESLTQKKNYCAICKSFINNFRTHVKRQSHLINLTNYKKYFGDKENKDGAINIVTKDWQCEVCHLGFMNNLDLKRHKRQQSHYTKQERIQRLVWLDRVVSNQTTKGEFKCPFKRCLKVYLDKFKFFEHFNGHFELKLKCKKCNRTVLGTSFKNHACYGNFPCEICGKVFMVKNYLKIHQITHSEEKSFKCHLCSKAYKKKKSLGDHLLQVHSVELPKRKFKRKVENQQIECEQCDEVMPKIIYQSHMASEHPISNPCEICGRTFKNNVVLKNHLKTHRDDRPFKCEICLVTYKYKLSLTEHMLKHTGERPFKCDECGKGFARKASLQKHQYRHTNDYPYKCQFCPRSYVNVLDLKKHICGPEIPRRNFESNKKRAKKKTIDKESNNFNWNQQST